MMSEGSRLLFDVYLEEYLREFRRISGKRVQDVVSFSIKDQRGGHYTIKSWKTMLFMMAWFGFVSIGTRTHVIGRQAGYNKFWINFPDPGTSFTLQLRSDLWNTIAATFAERGIAKVTHLSEYRYHEDIQALLLACNNNATVTMTFL